ncbi:MAG: reverse transcriptase-like protein [Candidatus Aenigmarchaeota archaeon]|nr:reverse transcriptase-like protein [Candidatus Aenigmarchaeota archaeon]NIP40687.1 reverse transcriptase-like protein [Candidatus Aenigmarchaeota archaeon]NIQ18493.1 reverse transcriptase-like protein [Candidatus Aenigmarchaeota archaeon]NIS73392.1 reverse transcriptase-like protein [Candidatus Aenigmarchaeota archaeon]
MIEIYTDGASRGNPGPGAIAFIIFKGEKIIRKHSHFIGKTTNNVAEYRALISALERARKLSKEVRLFSDSKLLVKQMKGEYKVKKPHIKELFEKAKTLEGGFEKIEYVHVNRTNPGIKMVDKMVNQVLDRIV